MTWGCWALLGEELGLELGQGKGIRKDEGSLIGQCISQAGQVTDHDSVMISRGTEGLLVPFPLGT